MLLSTDFLLIAPDLCWTGPFLYQPAFRLEKTSILIVALGLPATTEIAVWIGCCTGARGHGRDRSKARAEQGDRRPPGSRADPTGLQPQQSRARLPLAGARLVSASGQPRRRRSWGNLCSPSMCCSPAWVSASGARKICAQRRGSRAQARAQNSAQLSWC